MTGNDLTKFIDGQLALADRWVSGTADLGDLHIVSILVLAWLGIIMIVLVGTFIWLIWTERDTRPNQAILTSNIEPQNSNPEPKRLPTQVTDGIICLLRNIIFFVAFFIGFAILFVVPWVIAEIAGITNDYLIMFVYVVIVMPLIRLGYWFGGWLERKIFPNPTRK